MACSKCGEKFELKNEKGSIYFISEFDELMTKSKIFLEKLTIKTKESDGFISY